MRAASSYLTTHFTYTKLENPKKLLPSLQLHTRKNVDGLETRESCDFPRLQ